jgi:protein-tyrosine phosphatase
VTRTCIGPRDLRRGPRNDSIKLDPGLCGNKALPGSLFCRRHEGAAAANRGGWIAAENRRRKLAAADQSLDASNIMPRLWVGARPPADRDLPQFDVLVLCAAEYQPNPVAFHGQVLRCPIPDAPLTDHQVAHALMVARAVAAALAGGRRVLVTCVAGLNRAALVAALALALATRMGADELVQLMRERRGRDALFNPNFRSVIQRVAGAGRSPNRT